jgi:5'-methylthioadenosine phosphorylase
MAKTSRRGPVRIAVIGGSGVYEMEGLEDVREITVKTPFGNPSDAIVVGTLSGVRCAFLPRHGRGHRILPSEVNSRANIYALKTLGVEQVISISACGSLRKDVKPRDFIFPDQLYDRTKNRPSTFFGDGIVGHVAFAHPFCDCLRDVLHQGVKELGITHHFSGTYVCIEGPQFSTVAESEVNRARGFSVVGMTALPEAKLAREAGMCYATVGLVTDYDVWKEGEEVTVETVIENMQANVSNSKRLIKLALPRLMERQRTCTCSGSLQHAIMTNPALVKKSKAYKKIKLIIGDQL